MTCVAETIKRSSSPSQPKLIAIGYKAKVAAPKKNKAAANTTADDEIKVKPIEKIPKIQKNAISTVRLMYLFNVVTNKKDIPHAILIRSIEPVEGIETMMLRRQKKILSPNLSSGPGCVSAALGITITDTGCNLSSNRIWIEDRRIQIKNSSIKKNIP